MKVAIFIDGAHLAKVEQESGKHLSYQKLGDELTKGDFRVRTYYYDARPHRSDLDSKKEQELDDRIETFHHAIDKFPRFEIKLGRLQKINGKWIQKGVDMQLGVDMVQMSTNKQIDKAILIAADGDFVYAVKKAKEAGVVTTLVFFPKNKINRDLLKAVDEVIQLDDAFITKCLFLNAHNALLQFR